MKILLAPFGSRGDVHPMIALAQRLDREGHDVLIAGPPDYVTAAERRRLRYHAYGSAIDNFLADTAADYAGGSRRSHRALNRAIEMAIDDEFAALPALARGFDLIVGASVQAGAPSVAELLGIPYRYVVYCTALVPSPQSMPMLFPARSLPRWCIPLAWRLVRWGYNLSMRKQVNAHLNEQYGWGRQTHRLGIAVWPIPRSKLTAARLGAAISQAATDVALAREAKAIAARLRETDPLENALRELVDSPENKRSTSTE